MKTIKKIGLGGGIIALLLSGVSLFGATSNTEIVWDKPTTDVSWAEDVKKENFNIKSTAVLNTMIASLTTKLEREEKEFVKYLECPQCVAYTIKEDLQKNYPNISATELNNEVQTTVISNTKQRKRGIEKIRQSIERMNNEIRMRKSGYLIVNEPKLLGSTNIPLNRLRKIND